VAGNEELFSRFDLKVATGAVETGGLAIEALPTPGHADDHVAFLVNGELCLSGDILFKDAVGGGPDAEPIRRSVMDVLMALPHETRVLPGHTEETTIGREWESNPFVRYWRGEDPSLDEPVEVSGRAAMLVVWSPDYDGKGKALVRLDGGHEAIVGGSRVERISS
jgi:glyoxylase-like metal-dependent hydrolase (beta-lactamase superfamily II)